uniref:Arsenical pump membrane protein n=1 Tax=mine drainage metagenome TaxID=410659 RepID=E6PDY5_9ZZZZ
MENLPPPGEILLISIVVLALLGIITRPWGSHAWQWSVAAALALALGGAFHGKAAAAVGAALWGARDVGFFLAGIITIAAVATRARLFEVAAERLLALSGGRRDRLLLLTVGLGILCTALLSNDTTAVALTPAVVTLALAMKENPAPYAYACALVASAGSFLLPIANPANLLLYGAALPGLFGWLHSFALASFGALLCTYVVLRLIFARELAGRTSTRFEVQPLSARERGVGYAVATAVVLLLAASLTHRPPGLAALIGGALVLTVAFATRCFKPVDLRRIDLSAIAFVAGLLAILVAVERSGVLAPLHGWLAAAASHGSIGMLLAGFSVAAASAVANNLPIAALVAKVTTPGLAHGMHRALVIAVDLGPNLAMSGSLSTLLWATSLREHGIRASAREFARIGIACTVPALLAALVLARL